MPPPSLSHSLPSFSTLTPRTTHRQLSPLDRAACVACLRCVSEFLRSPESLALAERDLAAAAAAGEAGWPQQ